MPDAIRVMLIDAAKRCRDVNKVMRRPLRFHLYRADLDPLMRVPSHQSKSQAYQSRGGKRPSSFETEITAGGGSSRNSSSR